MNVGAVEIYEECGQCGGFHRIGYMGDCRNNDERFTADQLDDIHGPMGWDYIEYDSYASEE